MLTRPPAFRGVFRTDLPARAVYSEAAGIQQIIPAAVAVPESAEDVVTLVRWAANTRTPLTARGSGSSMAGAAIGPGVIVDLSRLRPAPVLDLAARRILVGPGALCAEVDAAAHRVGLRFPVDPSSARFCTIGGMAATNAAGAHSLRAGPMRPWVTALDCVFADGTRSLIRRGDPAPQQLPTVRALMEDVLPRTRRASADLTIHGVRKNSSGYALASFAESGEIIDLLVGSEGTLALFVGIELALEPAPKGTASLLAAFATLDDSVRGTAVARGAEASACELLDRTFLDLARTRPDLGGIESVPVAADAVLLIELESSAPSDLAHRVDSLATNLRRSGALLVRTALTSEDEHALWELRHAASPALAAFDPPLKSMQFIEDGTVPPAELAAYVRGVRRVLDDAHVRAAIFGHAGDGNIHVNPLIDVTAPDWRRRVDTVLHDTAKLTAGLGGTLTGEHGDGRVRAPYLPFIWGSHGVALSLFRAVKDACDPDGILNPGVKLADPAAGLGAIKYDPALTPLPAAARRALDRVFAGRDYATARLQLLDGD